MLQNKVSGKLINLTLLTFIIFLIYQMNNFWGGVISKVFSIFIPFLVAFIVAYALYPFLKFLENKGIPKIFAVILIVLLFLGILTLTGFLVFPLLIQQLGSLFNNIIVFLKNISIKHDLDFGPLQETLVTNFNAIMKTLGNYVSDGAIDFINISFNVITNMFISFVVAIYLLLDMDKIRNIFKNYLSKKSKRTYKYFIVLDKEMKLYLSGFIKIVGITFIEYVFVYYLINHPNALLLGFLAAIGNFIPFFGAILVNLVAGITAAVNVTDPDLFMKTIIVILILSLVDSYIINPTVYNKTNRVHPIVVIFSVFAGGYLFGFLGIIISLPLAIIIITTYKFYKTDIYMKITDIRETTLEKKKKKETKKDE